MHAIPAPTLVDGLLDAAFTEGRMPRSAEYKEGTRAALEAKANGTRVVCLYAAGTAQADAFYSGVDEGHLLWRQHLASEERRLGLVDRAALEIAHSQLRTNTPLDDMLKQPNLRVVVESVARRHVQRRNGFDPKKLQANDNE